MASPTSNVILAASLPSLSTPHFLAPVIVSAANAAQDRLLIVLFSRMFDADAISHTQNWDNVQRLLTYVYVQATKVAQDMDKLLLQIDVLLKGLGEDEKLPDDFGGGFDIVYRVAGEFVAAALPPALLELPHRYIDPSSAEGPIPPDTVNADFPSLFPVVALGGTFDHLHPGHKILLSMAAWIASQKVIVGVTDSTLLSSKSNSHVLESLETRKFNVRAFLELFKPGLEYDIVTIDDVYGPTGWDSNIQALVVSRETISGGEMIASHREKKQLPKLATFIIDVISHTSPNITEEDLQVMRQAKMSSTFIRQWIVMQQEAAGTTKSRDT